MTTHVPQLVFFLWLPITKCLYHVHLLTFKCHVQKLLQFNVTLPQ